MPPPPIIIMRIITKNNHNQNHYYIPYIINIIKIKISLSHPDQQLNHNNLPNHNTRLRARPDLSRPGSAEPVIPVTLIAPQPALTTPRFMKCYRSGHDPRRTGIPFELSPNTVQTECKSGSAGQIIERSGCIQTDLASGS